jgi:hypothetical protein
MAATLTQHTHQRVQPWTLSRQSGFSKAALDFATGKKQKVGAQKAGHPLEVYAESGDDHSRLKHD